MADTATNGRHRIHMTDTWQTWQTHGRQMADTWQTRQTHGNHMADTAHTGDLGTKSFVNRMIRLTNFVF